MSSAHVKMLEAAGAKVIPINYQMHFKKIQGILNQINGVYIPGDKLSILQNEKYMNTVALILHYASDFNHKNSD